MHRSSSRAIIMMRQMQMQMPARSRPTINININANNPIILRVYSPLPSTRVTSMLRCSFSSKSSISSDSSSSSGSSSRSGVGVGVGIGIVDIQPCSLSLIRRLRTLHDPHQRQQQQRFIIEGHNTQHTQQHTTNKHTLLFCKHES